MIMGAFQKIMIGFSLFLTTVVVVELVLLYHVDRKAKITSNVVSIKPTMKVQYLSPTVPAPIRTEQSSSCSNWYARYTHIESTQTVTKGVFSRLEVDDRSKETKIHLESGISQYYVSFTRDITKVTVTDALGKNISLSLLKKGDPLKVTEHYEKLADDKESFSITVNIVKP